MPAAHAKGMGVIAKRPIANAVWKETSKPAAYYQPYWERLHTLGLRFSERRFPAGRFRRASIHAGRADGVHTAIVGTTQPDRWRQNAELLQAGPLDPQQFQAIRSRWKSVAAPDWVGQT